MALNAQVPGFRREVDERKYIVRIGDAGALRNADLSNPLPSDVREVKILPAPKAAGVETFLLVGLGLVIGVGLAVAFSGLAKQPDPNERQDTNKNSGTYDGAVNVTEQGHARPLIYGRARVGSVVTSSGVTTGGRAVGTGSGFGGLLTPGAGGGGGLNPLGNDLLVFAKGGKGGGGSASAKEDPNTLQTNATARVIDLLGEGEIGGLVDGLKSIYFDDTVIQNADNTYNFKGVSIEERVGTPDQDFMPGFTSAETVRTINREARVDTAAPVETITNPNVDVARVTIKLSALYQQNTSNGDITGTSVQFAIDVQANGGGYTEVINHTITGKQNSTYQESYSIRLPAGGAPWNIRVRRITADHDESTIQDNTYFDLLTEVIEAKLQYPNCAMIGMTVDMLQFGSSVPTRSYDVYGRIIKVPTNYDPVARTYTGIWDGTFKLAWTDNPAWIYFDLVTNKRVGLGRFISEDQIDKYTLYTISQYCDELVDDGAGGTEPRYTYNGVINSRKKARDVINELAATFRSMTYWGTSQVAIVQDAPEDVSRLIAPANVRKGEFIYSGTSHDNEYSAFVVWWNDPAQAYRLTPEVVEDKTLMLKLGWKPKEYTAAGVTSRGHARRLAMLLKEDQEAAKDTLKYSAAFDHSGVLPGQVVDQFDPSRTTVNWAGRIAISTTTVTTLDRSVTLPAGPTYTLSMSMPDGTVESRTINMVATGNSATTSITVSSAFSVAPNPGAVWQIKSSTLSPRSWRVRGIAEGDDGDFSVTAVSHDPTKYDRVENGINLSTTPWYDLPSGQIQPPDNLFVTEYFVREGDATVPAALFSWQPSTDPRVIQYEVQVKRPGGDWEDLGTSTRVGREYRNQIPGVYSFRVRTLDAANRKSAWRATDVTLDGVADTIGEVSGITVTTNDDAGTVTLSWTMPTDSRPLKTQVGFSTTNDIGTATLLGTIDGTTWLVDAVGYYWLRPTFAGEYSPSPVSTQITAENLPSFSAGITEVDYADFAVGVEPVGIVDVLPNPVGYIGPQLVFLTTDYKMYRYTGSGWTAEIETVDLTGTIGSGQLADGAVTTAKFAAGIAPPTIKTSLPATGNYEGRLVMLTTDGKLYRYHSGAWTAAVPAADISGTLANAQIAALAAAKITGQLSDSQLAAISAAKLTGQIVGTQITDGAISTAKLAAGSVTAARIAAGTITASEIAAGAISATEIAAGAITTAKLAAGAVTAATIAAGTITASEIASNAITTAKITADAITTAKIAAGAVSATEIAAGAITTAKIAAGAVSATEIAAGAIIASKIAAGAVSASKIAAGAIIASKIAAGTITGDKISANTITTGLIAAGAISATQIAANAVTADKMNVSTLSAITANMGSITAGSLSINNKFIVDSSGNVTIRNATTGQRLTLTNSLLSVYDASNVLRVRLGIW